MIENVPARWDVEADLVAIGSGIGGLAAAITAHDHGLKALVLERSDQVGGVTAMSLGEVWVAGNHLGRALGISDSPERGFRYLKRLSMGYGDDQAILNFTVHARVALKYFEDRAGVKMRAIPGCPDYYYKISNNSVTEGRMLETLPFDARTLGSWQSKTRISPLVPYGLTHADMFAKGGLANPEMWDFSIMADRMTRDERCLGPGLAAFFIKAVLDRDIPMATGINVAELIGDGTRVIGVRAVKDGKDYFVKAARGVVIASSSYERNQKLNKTLGTQLKLESMLFPTIDGANFRLAGPFGARIAKVPDITALCFHVPGEEHENGEPLWRAATQVNGLPHTIVVNRMGRRFGNESHYRSLGYAVDTIDGGTQTHPNFPCWTIFDSQAREKYMFGTVPQGVDLPEGLGVSATSIPELAAKIGVDADGLAATISRFNHHAEKGEDPDFQRGTHPWSAWFCGDINQKPHPNLGTLAKAPFYAVRLHRMGGTGVPSTGLVTDIHARVLGWDDKPIEGLYAAGNSVARMESGALLQSGVSNARGMTHGYLAGLHAAGNPSDRLQRAIAQIGFDELNASAD